MGDTVVYVIERRSEEFYVRMGGDSGFVLQPHHLKHLEGCLVVCDLREHGLELIVEFFHKNGVAFTVQAYRLNIYSIKSSGVIIKCSSALGFSAGNLLREARDLDLIARRFCGVSLKGAGLISIGSIAARILRRLCPEIIECEHDGDDGLFRSSLIGGLNVTTSSGYFRDVNYFDFPSMYGNIMTEEFFWGYERASGDLRRGDFARVRFVKSCAGFEKFWFADPDFDANVFFFEAELSWFRERGGEFYVTELWRPKSSGAVLKKAALGLMDMRRCGATIAKIALNGVFGRLGLKQSRSKTKLVMDFDVCETLSSGARFKFIKNVGLVEQECGDVYNPKKNLLVAAQIAAHGRIKLRDAAVKIESIGGVVLALRTDAVFYTGPKCPEYFQKTIEGVTEILENQNIEA